MTFNVSDPRTQLLGGPEMYLDTFSGIVNLTCVIETLEPPKKVLWYHNETEVLIINYLKQDMHLDI